MAASGRTSAPVAACGILVALGAPNSYNSIYSRFPFNGWVGAFTSEPGATVISRQRMFCWSEGDFATAKFDGCQSAGPILRVGDDPPSSQGKRYGVRENLAR